MAQQPYFGYIAFPAARSSAAQTALPGTLSPSPPLSGRGSPEGSIIGVPGQKYTDILTGNIYIKVAGTQEIGWLQNGVSQGIVTGTVDVADDGSVWGKTPTGWAQLAGG